MTLSCLLLVLLLAASPLPLAAADVHLRVPDALDGVWAGLVAGHPLPAGTRILQEGADDTVCLEVLGGGSPRAAGAWKVVERTVFAPVSRLGASDAQHTGIAPLESIRLPAVALPADGLFPGEPGYSLVRETALVVDSSDPGLLAWFDLIPPALAPVPEEPIAWICAVGDIMPARGVDALLLAQGGLQKVFGDTLSVLEGASLLLGNLEAAATRRGARATKSFTFRFEPAALEKLAEAGFTYLSLTNNHSFDFGAEGFLDTLSALERAGIATSGAGRTEADAFLAVEMDVGDTRVRILSFGAYPVDRTGFDGRRATRADGDSPGVLWLDEKSTGRAAAQFGQDTLDIVMVHGGEEWTRAPTAAQRALYGRLVQAGADIVIGSHSHVLQPVEAVEGGLVAWSLGNFLFPGMEGTPGGEEAAILRLGVYKGAVRYVQSIPVRLAGTTVRLRPTGKVSDPARVGVQTGETQKETSR